MKNRHALPLLYISIVLLGTACNDESNLVRRSPGENQFAMRFFGTGSAVEIQRPTVSQPSHFTIEMWVYLDTLVSTYTPFMSANVNERNSADGYSFKYESNKLFCRVATTGNVAAAYWTTFSPAVRQWFHVAATFDGTQAKLYVDGVERSSLPSAGPVWYGPAILWLGCGYHADFGGYSFFRGMLDEVRVWNRARTAWEIKMMKDSVLTGTEESLVGYWNFDDTTHVNTVLDMTPNRNHGLMWGKLSRVPSTPF